MANCFAVKGDLPIEITWSLNGRSITEIHGVFLSNLKRSNQLSIDSVAFEHAGEYTCTAKNSVGSNSYSTMLNVNGSKSLFFVCVFCCFFIHFLFVVPPQISPFDFGEESVNSGDATMVNCFVVKGDFPLKIFWTLNGKAVSDFHGISLINSKRNSQLNIENVYFDHAGEFTCTAKNKAGTSSYSAQLNVNGIVC